MFPAYSVKQKESEINEDAAADCKATPAKTDWLENSSFAVQEAVIKDVQKPATEEGKSSTSSSSSDEDSRGSSKKSKKKKKKKHKRKRKESPPPIVLEFDGTEEYYVDKAPVRAYLTLRTLHKPACPRYNRPHMRPVYNVPREWESYRQRTELHRYYEKPVDRGEDKKAESASLNALNEEEYTTQLGAINRRIMASPGQLDVWLDLIRLHEQNPYRWSRLLLAEKKIDVLMRALSSHPRNDTLYRLYIETINSTYPSFEISKLLDRLLAKDPYSYTLWTALIMTTQGSMARCIVPDVLRIYERCMQRMHQHQQQDEIMLKLFSNCAMFLRQAGLYEQFFALVKLALDLNVSTEGFSDFRPRNEDQQTLIEYEELILRSGLPMNEIWRRIEKLRQGFNFLPCPPNMQCSDPQRMVFNEDVCHYIYPLKSRDNSFYMMLLVLRLLKLPFVQCDGLAERFNARVEHIGDSDAIEDVLAVFLRRTYALPLRKQDEFLVNLYELAREMAVNPTFLSNSIGFEIYVRCINDMLESCASAYDCGRDEAKRCLFLLLKCRFERLLLVLEKCSGKMSEQFVKEGRSRFKALLKRKENRNVLNFYTEFALYEFEALNYDGDMQAVRNIFENLISANALSSSESIAGDLCHSYACYAEILIGRGNLPEALQIIASFALGFDLKEKRELGAAGKLSALQKLSEKCEQRIQVERNVSIMVLEQYMLPDHTISLIKLKCYLLHLVGKKHEALEYLEKLLRLFGDSQSARNSFLREMVYELYATLLQMPSPSCKCSNSFVTSKTFEALASYPRNLYLLQRCSMLTTPPWFKLRAVLMGSTPSILSIVFLIATARYRFLAQGSSPTAADFGPPPPPEVAKWDRTFNEAIVRNRILNVFQSLAGAVNQSTRKQSTRTANYKTEALQRNALFWRFYLRCISDQSTAFDTSKKCLLTALDECPWSKALYLDGATYVPQELSHLQDLIIEKQLRIYALPEELQILRED